MLDDVLANPRANHRRPHSGLARILLRLVVNHLVRPAHDFGQSIRLRQISVFAGRRPGRRRRAARAARERIASTAIWLATSPAGAPPMPSQTTNRPSSARSM